MGKKKSHGIWFCSVEAVGQPGELAEVKSLYAPWLLRQSTKALECLGVCLAEPIRFNVWMDVCRPAGAA